MHTHLSIVMEDCEASVSARVNHYAYEPQYAFQTLDDQPVYEFRNALVVRGRITAPEEREDDCCEITLYGEASPARDLDARLADITALDKHGAPRFRTYRGREVPVYKPPDGLGVLDKAKGEPLWRTSLFIKPWLVEQWMALLGSSRDLFISLHECKVGRKRWVRGIELGTANPEEE
ncbi:hypothetical protein OZN62_06785 [Aurantiacibacter sp. MUD11]|uniref:hypothetical protein n=1 Tax=Aurantiacibacter sp. MUD11 TaxID=3003265 RepID=UPI0022AB1046|nr:hypothetical protein [Aurantiacibacter sp. MUD11]WAT19264.1 hypothetical protein OZN62_06785 [Aurantiacibacter sp. MUD11]